MWSKYLKNEDGATAIEYGILIAILGMMLAVSGAKIGPLINDNFYGYGGDIDSAGDEYITAAG